MCLKAIKVMMTGVLFSASVCSLADDATNASLPTAADLAQRQLMLVMCPKPSDLVLDPTTRTWSALHKWASSSVSLATQMTTFLGAQWQGINLGQPFCIYQGLPEGTFKVALAYHTFSVTPEGGRWTSNAHHNLYRCLANDPMQCPFFTRLKPKAVSIQDQLMAIEPGHHADDLASQGF